MNHKYISILLGLLFVLIFGSFIVTAADYYDDYYTDDLTYNTYSHDTSDIVLLIFVVTIVIILFYVIFAVFIYFDAKKRGENPWIWVLIIVLSSFVGIIVWLVVRPPIGGDPYKRRHGSSDPFQTRNNYYANHGRMCPACGRSIPFDAKFCPFCTKRFDDLL